MPENDNDEKDVPRWPSGDPITRDSIKDELDGGFFGDETDLASKIIRYLLSDCCVDRGDTFSFHTEDRSRVVNCGEHLTQAADNEGIEHPPDTDPSEVECGCECGCLLSFSDKGVVCPICRETCGGGA